MNGGKLQIRRRFRFSAKGSEDGYISFMADGGDIKISGVTGRCYDVECAKRLVRKMISAPETPPYYIREMAETVLRHVLQMEQEIGWRTSVSVGAATYIYDKDGPELTLDISLWFRTLPKAHYDEWYITIRSSYRGSEATTITLMTSKSTHMHCVAQ